MISAISAASSGDVHADTGRLTTSRAIFSEMGRLRHA